MTPHLTPEQRQALSEHPDQAVFVIDDATNRSFVLLPAENYEKRDSSPPVGTEALAGEGNAPNDAEHKKEKLGELIAATAELFGGDVSVYESFDPEYPDDVYTVLAVRTRLAPAEAVRTERDWIRRSQAIGRCLDDVRLSIRFAQ
jgi:hypothetical protein